MGQIDLFKKVFLFVLIMCKKKPLKKQLHKKCDNECSRNAIPEILGIK